MIKLTNNDIWGLVSLALFLALCTGIVILGNHLT